MAVEEGMEELAIRSLFGSRSQGTSASASITSREPCLVAVVEDPLVPVEMVRRKPQVNDLALLVARLPLRLAPGRKMAVAKWMMSGRPIAANGAIGGGDEWNPQLSISQGSVVFEFRAPFGENGGRAIALALSAGLGANRGPGAPPRGAAVSAFNQRLNSWQQLPGNLPSVKFPTAADYMSRDGRVLVKIAAHADTVELADVGISGVVETF
jgi:hypothetical protein